MNEVIFTDEERNQPKINVWCGLSKNEEIKPFFFAEKYVNGDFHLDELETIVFLTWRNGNVNSLYFQHDGALPHYKTVVWDPLNVKFPNRWIGRGGPIARPSRSLDPTPCDFFRDMSMFSVQSEG